MNDAKQPTTETTLETAPEIDYTKLEKVKAQLEYDERKAVTERTSNLSVGDSVRINDRARPLTVVPQHETDLLEMAHQETLFLKGNGTEYRIKIGHYSLPELDRGSFTKPEYIGYLAVVRDGREPSDSIDCVLCDETSATPEQHHEHMEEIHDC